MENDNGDPVTGKSLSGPIMVCSLLMLVALAWAIYDDGIGQRPWKSYQRKFIALYSAHLKKLETQAAGAEREANASDGLRAINDQIKQEEQTSAAPLAEVRSRLLRVDAQLDSLREPFQDARARLAALTYDLDRAGSADEQRRLRERVDLAQAVLAPLEANFNQLKAAETQLIAREQELTARARELKQKRDAYMASHVEGLSASRIAGLLRKAQDFRVEIKQIYVPEAGIVDRCESCHLGTREPVTLVSADMGNNPVFTSHPDPSLLPLHDPSRFGCSLCHNGNGAATSSVNKAHGENAEWPWPLFGKANVEAGCLQCHVNDRLLEHAPELNRARDLYWQKGCAGCHRHAEFDREADALTFARREIGLLEAQQTRDRTEIDREVARGDAATNNDEARRHYAESENLRILVSRRAGRIAELNRQSGDLMRDRKEIGPNLKDVRLKLRRAWIPVWLKDPQAFRPGTRMPHFRLRDEEVRAISAFIWQAGVAGPALASEPKGDAARGKEIFETRGCMGCHSTGEGATQTGGDFAANLSRISEKAGYDYLVRWILDPRQRTRPWCAREKRDLGPEDYAKRGLPFTFDPEHDTCPNDGSALQVQNMTVMPNLRLSPEEARDVATYLMELKHSDAADPDDGAFMDDRRLYEAGRNLVSRLGCANCHEIRGFEEAARVGAELSKEADKPVEQLDFGLLERIAKKEGWYNLKGFFDHKLRDPAIYDRGRQKAPEDKLRMPDIALSGAEANSLATFLLGSADVPARDAFRIVPAEFRYAPSGPAKDIQEGWWVVKKYNCMGCHELEIGQKSALSQQPRYQDADGKEQLPPSLHEEGARVNPEWLAKFLENPQNGVRPYLLARMPTFSFSPREIGILVRFFEALAGQPSPWIQAVSQPLDEQERQMARALFSSPAAPCLRCHLTGDPRHDRTATAPNFLTAAGRLKPAWTAQWMRDPQNLSPGTAMPAGLFRRDGDRWVFAGEAPAAFRGYNRDQADLLVRYMFQLDAGEQRRLIGMMPAAPAVP